MDNIQIIDDFLTDEDIEHITNFDNYSDKTWIIQRSSETEGHEFLMKDLTHDSFYTSYLGDKIKKTVLPAHQPVNNCSYVLDRVYLNGQWPGREGGLHSDECTRTVLLYITPCDPDWGGFTQIVKSPTEQIIIPPVFKRLVSFPGNMLHKGYSFANQNCPMRITVAFKFFIPQNSYIDPAKSFDKS